MRLYRWAFFFYARPNISFYHSRYFRGDCSFWRAFKSMKWAYICVCLLLFLTSRLFFWLAPLGQSTGSGGDQSAVSHWQVLKYEVCFLLMKYSIHTNLSQNQWSSLCILPGYQSPCQWVIPVSLFSLLERNRLRLCLKAIAHPKMKICKNFTQPQAILNVDEFVSSSEHFWRNILHHLLTNGSSAVNGCRQNESPNSW